ncbi:MAG: glycosyltransferase [Kaiparowitsia implicata GSE-PSE-MK54-09C]|jgi:glycosyltransferase involved in cell wall biosynthesis|nr:glycosyltransferase [Kaiparowitsia implicata GSE-PSE-MK54-09C]
MLYPSKVVDIELSQPISTLHDLEGYVSVQGLVRLYGTPLAYIQAPIVNGECDAATISNLILEHHSWAIAQTLLGQGLATNTLGSDFQLSDLVNLSPPAWEGEYPLVTVAVCTRDRASDLALCLNALGQLDYPNLDILIVDNAPTSDATQQLVAQYPQVRYVREPRPGLDWARNRAILEVKGDIIAYTDDDVVVDAGWITALAKVFVENPDVMALTGLIVPYVLDAESQALFELYGGFGRGFQRKWRRIKPGDQLPWQLVGTGQFGAGANMAYRRCVFEQVGYFDPAMDVGTVTNGGGDLEMYFRILKEGHTLVYEPRAMVRHRHRPNYEKLRSQIENNGIGLYSYFTCCILKYPESTASVLYLAVYWLAWWHIRRVILSYIHPSRFPRDLILAEFQGVFKHVGRYQSARRNAKEVEAAFPNEPAFPERLPRTTNGLNWDYKSGSAIRSVELTQALAPIQDVAQYAHTKMVAMWNGTPLGTVDIDNIYQSISVDCLVEAMTTALGMPILQAASGLRGDRCWAAITTLLAQTYGQPNRQHQAALLKETPVTIVVSATGCANALTACLQSVMPQAAQHNAQVIVINSAKPSHGAMENVVAQFSAQFSDMLLLNLSTQGVAAARNQAIQHATGAVIALLDGDVTVPTHWLEQLIAPFARPEVMAVTGNVLAADLEAGAQRLFEIWKGLGRGFEPFDVGKDWAEACWYRSIPTWNLGTGSNAAVRASVFSDPHVGLMDEALGWGTLTGGGEDCYLFYKILKLGHILVYQPSAYAWHTKTPALTILRSHVFNSGKGHVAYQLATLFQDGDARALARLFLGLPLQHVQRIYYRLRGWDWFPLSLILLEITGNLVGIPAYGLSRLQVQWRRWNNRLITAA